MTCGHCGRRMTDLESRCSHCGRRPEDAPRNAIPISRGALAAQIRPEPPPEALPPQFNAKSTASEHAGPSQGRLFAYGTSAVVIPFPATASRKKNGPGSSKSGTHVRRSGPGRRDGQTTMDFIPQPPSKPKLSTTVDAVILCDAPVAARLHRAIASAIDLSLILIGYVLFLAAIYLAPVIFHFQGGVFTLTRPNLLALCAGFAFIAFGYGALWAVAGSETAGMSWTGLRLLTFDGLEPDRGRRMARYFGACLSILAVVGLLWCLADEERLSWADHISGTFPTPGAMMDKIFRRH